MFRTPQPTSPTADLPPAIISFPTAASGSMKANAIAQPKTEAPCELTAAFVTQFEKVSGWEVQFVESASSKCRLAESKQAHSPEGRFEIVDMSAEWPANKPTMHRGKCDELIDVFSKLVAKQNYVAGELQKAQATLASITNNAADGEVLVDSFLPLGPPTSFQESSDDDDWVLDQDAVSCDSDFVVQQAVGSDWLVDGGSWENWSVAGATGIAGDRYLDWAQSPEKITVFVGRIESSLGSGDAESRLDICPNDQRFRVSDSSRFSTFFAWDRRGSRLEKVEPGVWQQLPPGGAVVVSTTPDVELPSTVKDLDASSVTAEQLAAAIENQIDDKERLMVIKYC